MTPTSTGQGSAPQSQIAQFRSDGFTSATGLRVPFLADAFSRAYGLPSTLLNNLISESTPLREERPYVPYIGVREVHYSRPGLVSAHALGTGPIRGMCVSPSAFKEGFFWVTGTSVRDQAGSSRGTIPGSDLVRCAASRTQMVAVAGGVAYLYEGTGAFTAIVSGVLPPVIDVAYLAGRFIYQVKDSDRFYWSEVNDAANINGLSFATAESDSDNTLALAVVADELVVFGDRTTEFWQPNTGAGLTDPAYIPIVGRGYPRGCASRDSLAHMDNTIFWVGDNRVVYRAGQEPTRVSSNTIEDKLRQCADITGVTAWAATFEGHDLYVLNIPGVGTFVYDASRITAGGYASTQGRGEWSQWSSFGRDTGFRGRLALTIDDVTYVGDDTTADVWTMANGVYTDGGDPLARQASVPREAIAGFDPTDGALDAAVASARSLQGMLAPPAD